MISIRIDRPMGITDLAEAAERFARQSSAMTSLMAAVAAFEDATGLSIAVVDADAKLLTYGVDLASAPDKTMIWTPAELFEPHSVPPVTMPPVASMPCCPAVAGDPPGTIGHGSIGNTAAEAQQDAELLEAMFPAPAPEVEQETLAVTEARTAAQQAMAAAEQVEDAAVPATAATRAEPPALPLVEPQEARVEAAPAPAAPKAKKAASAQKIDPRLEDAVIHINGVPVFPKWNRKADLELMTRALDGESVTLIADVMEFSPSYIRQRFNLLVGRKNDKAEPMFSRQDVLAALRIITGEAA